MCKLYGINFLPKLQLPAWIIKKNLIVNVQYIYSCSNIYKNKRYIYINLKDDVYKDIK